ncbi:unnamed protein product [Toxocara canis]|uniref:SH3 domain-containing protein n=1 Tax=Toxocara canis TaxID=6265 RepID=A0A183UBJ2_TOXCA|nr:unnamed protein product [Toxocara canis]
MDESCGVRLRVELLSAVEWPIGQRIYSIRLCCVPMLHYSKSLKAIRSHTESLYDSARRKLTHSLRGRRSRRGHSEYCVAVDDFEANESDQLSVTKGQRLEVVELYPDAPEWVLVSCTEEGVEPRQGLVPASVLSSAEASVGVFLFLEGVLLSSLFLVGVLVVKRACKHLAFPETLGHCSNLLSYLFFVLVLPSSSIVDV